MNQREGAMDNDQQPWIATKFSDIDILVWIYRAIEGERRQRKLIMNCPLVVDKCPKDCPHLTRYGCGLMSRLQHKQLDDLTALRQASKIRG